jgi:hypothetical protein
MHSPPGADAPGSPGFEVEIIPRAAFEPLTRAGLRLALREAAP